MELRVWHGLVMPDLRSWLKHVGVPSNVAQGRLPGFYLKPEAKVVGMRAATLEYSGASSRSEL